MKSQLQKSNDDCFGACIASILELSEWPIFNPQNKSEYWLNPYTRWLSKFNLALISIEANCGFVPPGYSIGSVKSKNLSSARHAVVCRDGKIVHDPSNLKKIDNRTKLTGWFVFTAIDASKFMSLTTEDKIKAIESWGVPVDKCFLPVNVPDLYPVRITLREYLEGQK